MWILIAVSTVATALYLKFVLRKNSFYLRQIERKDGKVKGVIGRDTVFLYVMGNLVSQGTVVLFHQKIIMKIFEILYFMNIIIHQGNAIFRNI